VSTETESAAQRLERRGIRVMPIERVDRCQRRLEFAWLVAYAIIWAAALVLMVASVASYVMHIGSEEAPHPHRPRPQI
jgi:cytoskeletal protein RodZ